MEKIMIISLAVWLGLILSVAPGGTSINAGPHLQKISQKGIPDKPIKPHEHAIFIHQPE